MKRFLHICILVLSLTFFHTSPARGDTLPDSAYVSGVSGHAQGYSLSCEARSAVDIAAFWGVGIGETEFLQALPRADNPDEGFVGNPNDAWGNIPRVGTACMPDRLRIRCRSLELPLKRITSQAGMTCVRRSMLVVL